MKISIILFPEFESLDVFGPVEVFGKLTDELSLNYFSAAGGIVSNSDNVRLGTDPVAKAFGSTDILFVPGGMGTRKEAVNKEFLGVLSRLAAESKYILSVCTGSLLLARAGILKGKKATTNKRAFNEVIQHAPGVDWMKKARWVKDGRIYTSSGVSAGIDMALAFIEDVFGKERADAVSVRIEYERNTDSKADRFSDLYE